MLKLLSLIVAYGIVTISADETDPIVCLAERGCVRGKVFKGNTKEFEGFLGIPYAQSPIGALRLKVSFK
jgi:carboxylesterase type B